MKRQYLIIAILALLLPALARAAWFYRGDPPQRPEIATPDYASFERPQAPVNTPQTSDIEPVGGIVLLDAAHGNQFNLSEIDSLAAAIRARGGNLETVSDALQLETSLKYASAYITVSPTLTYSVYETRALKDFTDRGGKLLVFVDATRYYLGFDMISGNPIPYGDVDAANSLLKMWDISVNNDYLYNVEKNEGNFRNVIFDQFGKSELTFGLNDVALYGARSVESDSGLILLQGSENTLSSKDDAHDPTAGGAILSEDGSVAAFGDFTFLSAPYSTYTDNAILIQNLSDFTLSGETTASLDVFPYLFTGETVQVYVSSELEKDPTLVNGLGSLQTTMRALNYKVEFVEDVPSSGDVIIIGLLDSTDEFNTYLKKADVDIEFNLISTVEFGDIRRAGNGLLLFNAGAKGNTLAVLAETPEDLLALLGVLGGDNGLDACLTSEQVAVCGVGYGSSYEYDSYEEPAAQEPEQKTESTEPSREEVTPTPGG
ncbi:MAG: hypothetical protein HXY38_03880 [Chloroflexi bacterium]|nr:hypothetical protein [Chloroflexota bacterium]